MKTIRTFILLFVCLACFTNLQAQFALGGKVGLNLAAFSGDEDELGDELKRKLGIQAGLVFVTEITDVFGVQTELLFMQKGVRVEVENIFGAGDRLTGKFILNYLEIPLMARIAIGEEGTRFYATLGPSFGFAANGKVKSEVVIMGEKMTEEDDLDFGDSNFNRFDLGIALGAGGLFDIGGGDFFVDVRFLQGFSDIDGESDDFTIRNTGLGISFGFLANISGE